jgi:hypothetical protein
LLRRTMVGESWGAGKRKNLLFPQKKSKKTFSNWAREVDTPVP